MCYQPGVRLLHNTVRKHGCAAKKDQGTGPNVASDFQLREDVRIKTNQGKKESNRQEEIRIKVEIQIFFGGIAIVPKDVISRNTKDHGGSHIRIQKNISSKRILLDCTNYNCGLQESAEEPDGVLVRTEHSTFLAVP